MGKTVLQDLKPQKEFFIGIDSDGCAFPTMELKHKECFVPCTIRYWALQSISKYVRETEEWVNLYSKWRGENRFPALVKVFDLLAERPEVRRSQASIPETPALRAWIAAAGSLGNSALRREIERNPAPDLLKTLQWSEAVNAAVQDMVVGVPPFPGVRCSLEKMAERADLIVVSGTPGEALEREWAQAGIDGYVRVMAGQELGKKKEHLELAAAGKYPPEKILMIGDAPADLSAAQAVGVQFYPINPGSEEASWERFHEEALERFFAGTYAGAYGQKLVEEFGGLLPDAPPWPRAWARGARTA